jgi:TrmH family RNA methyltransferase
MKITSVNNEMVKEAAKLQQKKFRDESGLFLLEGDKCIEEAINAGVQIEKLFVIENYDKFNISDRIETTDAVLSKLSSTATPPKSVAIGKKIKSEWKETFNNVVLLENIKDAGNLGTIIRTSCAFNVDAVILYGDTVDLYNPKCVRATVGNLWKVPVFEIKDFSELKKMCKDFTPIATLPRSENTVLLKNYKSKDKQLIMFGTESSGLSNELINYAEKLGKSVTIEMSDKVESLNLSISVGVILYKIFM